MRSLSQNVRTPSRPGDGALPNSDMREPFDYKMIELLTQRARRAPRVVLGQLRASEVALACSIVGGLLCDVCGGRVRQKSGPGT